MVRTIGLLVSEKDLAAFRVLLATDKTYDNIRVVHCSTTIGNQLSVWKYSQSSLAAFMVSLAMHETCDNRMSTIDLLSTILV